MARIKGTRKDDVLKGGKAKDKIVGLAGDDKLVGLGGEDRLNAGDGDDRLVGGGGNDRLFGALGDDVMTGGAGNDELAGGLGNDVLKGGKGNDRIAGGEGDDRLLGGAGDDVMLAGSGNDIFNGGAGSDWVNYVESSTNIYIDLANNAALAGAAGDTVVGIENVQGTFAADYIAGDAADNYLAGGDGKDSLIGRGGKNVLEGGGGDDFLYGGEGVDTFLGGNGIDTASYAFANAGVVVHLASGFTAGAALGDSFDSVETITGTDFADILHGDGAANLFNGQGGADVLEGFAGNDVLNAGGGSDVVNGGEGDDRIVAGESNAVGDAFIGGKGNDWVDYAGASAGVTVSLKTGAASGQAAGDSFNGIENVAGSNHDDSLQAAKGGRAYGNGGNDIIIDADGTEYLRGGTGDDLLSDQIAAGVDDGLTDIFFLEPGMGSDTVFGFDQGEDVFWLWDEQFARLSADQNGVMTAGSLINSISNAATGSGAQLIYETDTKVLWYDQDGIGGMSAVEVATLSGGPASLSRSDFLVVPEI
jgi:Ca2+-binding RTX toxin-like protein